MMVRSPTARSFEDVALVGVDVALDLDPVLLP